MKFMWMSGNGGCREGCCDLFAVVVEKDNEEIRELIAINGLLEILQNGHKGNARYEEK